MENYKRFMAEVAIGLIIGFAISMTCSLAIATLGLFISYIIGLNNHFMFVMRWTFLISMAFTTLCECARITSTLYLIPKQFKISRETAIIAVMDFKLFKEEERLKWSPEQFQEWFKGKQHIHGMTELVMKNLKFKI